jgi:hypothetical protein
MIAQILDLIAKMFGLSVGVILEVDLDNEECIVKIHDVGQKTCKLSLPHAHSEKTSQTVWGHINYPSPGDFALILLDKEQPEIIQYVNGKENIADIYNNGKLAINRIADSEDTDKTPDARLKVGEFILRSIGLGDIFFDKFGNIILDTDKELVMRFGNRDSANKITTPETTLRVGKVKGTDGNTKKVGGKEIKLELVFKTNNQVTLDEDGKWNIENANASIAIQNDGKIIVNGGSTEVARNGDDVQVTLGAGTYTNMTVGGQPLVVTTPQNIDGTIQEGNENLLCD